MTNKILSAACMLAATGLANADVVFSSLTPTVDGADIANIVATTGDDKFFGDTPNPGQSFTTGGDAGYSLSALSFQLRSDSDTESTEPPPPGERGYTVRLVTISGTDTTTIASESMIAPDGHTWSQGDWMSFELATPFTLNSNTLYGIDVEQTSGNDWANGIPYIYKSGDEYAGGEWYTRADGDPSSINTASSSDRIFHLDMQVVPEPSTLALIGLTGLGLMLRRRR